MKTWPDKILAIIGIAVIVAGHIYVFVFARPTGAPRNGIMFSDYTPPRLYPACDAYPNGLDGGPCADADEHERTGRLVLHYPK